MPTPCPPRLRRLIERVNQDAGDEPRILREIVTAIQKRRHDANAASTYEYKTESAITVNLDEITATTQSKMETTIRTALLAIDPPDLVDRVHKCPVCPDLFWASTSLKKACDKHGERVKQANYRRKKRENEARKTLLAMGAEKLAVIRAVMDDGPNTFGAIDARVWQRCNESGEHPIHRSAVRKAAHELYKAGFLDYRESADRRDACGFSRFDRYPVTVKLDNLWRDADISDLSDPNLTPE